MSRGLKFLTHNNTTLYNLKLLAGVDEDDDDTENSSDQKNIQDDLDSDQTNEDEDSEHNQDRMDPNNIAALTKPDIIHEDNISLEEENDNYLQPERETDGHNQESESEETNLEEETEEDLIHTQHFDNNQ